MTEVKAGAHQAACAAAVQLHAWKGGRKSDGWMNDRDWPNSGRDREGETEQRLCLN